MMETFGWSYIKPGLKNLNLIALCWRLSEWPRQRMGTRCGPAKWQTKLAASTSLSGTVWPTWSSFWRTLSSSLKVVRVFTGCVPTCTGHAVCSSGRLENSARFILSEPNFSGAKPSSYPTRWFRTAVLVAPWTSATSPASKTVWTHWTGAPHQVLVVACTLTFPPTPRPSTWIIWSQLNHSCCLWPLQQPCQ